MALSKEQRLNALEEGNRLRISRSVLMRQVYNGHLDFAEALRHPHFQGATLLYMTSRLPYANGGPRTIKTNRYIRPRYDLGEQFCRRADVNPMRLVRELTKPMAQRLIDTWDATPITKPVPVEVWRSWHKQPRSGVAPASASAPTRERSGDTAELHNG